MQIDTDITCIPRRSEKTFTIDGTMYYVPKSFLSGFTMKMAQDVCKAKGMIVFEPKDASSNHEVWEMMKNDGVYWVNIQREDPTKAFKSGTDGSKPSYTNWAPGEPNNWNNGNENCVWANFRYESIFYYADQWVDVNCNSPAQVVCQEQRDKVAQDVEISLGGKKYVFKMSQTGNLTQAQKICADEDKIVFQPMENQTSSAILTQATDLGLSRIWLNIRRKDAESPFRYLTNNETLVWEDWAPHEPNDHAGQGEFCVMTHWNSPWKKLWMDVKCSTDGNIVCQQI